MRISLSPMELSFWYQYRYDPSSDAQNIVHRLIISNAYSDEQLKESLLAVLQRHAVLRSRFDEANGTPYRYINDEISYEYINGDMDTNDALVELARKPFVLERGSLVRMIAKRDGDTTVLFVTVPHIIFDAFSWSIFTQELIRGLKRTTPRRKSFAPLYPVYPVARKEAQNYWTNKLRSVEGRVEFELDVNLRVRPMEPNTFVKKNMHELFCRLSEYGKKHSLSMNTLCMTILSLAIYKLTEKSRMIIATPVATRDQQSEDYIGSYINVLPSVFEPEANKTFLEYAQAAALDIWQDVENRDFSLIESSGSAQTARYDDGKGIYNVMAEYTASPVLHPDIIEDVIVPNNQAKLDITFSVTSSIEDHAISVEFDTSRLSRRYIENIVDTFITIASSVLDDPNQEIQSLRLVGVQEENKLLALGRGPIKEVRPPYVWKRFKNVALAHPTLLAITDMAGLTTYGELLDLSLRYAGYLEENGISKKMAVGVYMERSADYVATMMAIWSLGAVYVPLDPQQPVARLESMAKQANVVAIVTNGAIEARLESVPRLDVTKADEVNTFASDYEPEAEDVAYIIFTSGSTGTPKGVIIKHSGFLNHLEIMIDNFILDPSDVVAQTASPSFDISVWQLTGALMVGASLVIVDHDQLIDPDQMYRIIKDNSVTILEIVPSLISGYLSNEVGRVELAGRLEGLKIITTGEAISGSVVSQWMDSYPSTPLYNAYGPAEGSDDTHMYILKKDSLKPNQTIPIGRPLQNVHTYIVNHEMHLVPAGIVGEICIGGLVVAGGYIGDSELTSRSFFTNPMPDGQGLLYRTGDYGSWNEDGTLSYRGRRDNQVKVRGQRLEVGEVEEQLKRVDGVIDAAVVAVAGKGGTKLCGYIVVKDKKTTADTIKGRLKATLPEFMIPQTMEILERLPRNNNGKLDRKALKDLSALAQTKPISTLPAQYSPTLSTVIGVYAEVLKVAITQDSNYFECGGDSLQSMRIASLLAKHNIAVGIRDILLYQTPLELTVHINAQLDKSAKGHASWRPLATLTPIQQEYLSASGEQHRASGEIQAAVIPLDSHITADKLFGYLITITEAHEELKPLKSSSPLVIPNSWNSGETLDDIIEAIRSNISLEHPLVACILPKNELLLVAHHFVLDFYSWQLLQGELSALVSDPELILEHENLLKKWWGNALKQFEDDCAAIDKAQDYWRPRAKATGLQLKTTETRHHTFKCELPTSLLGQLNESFTTPESLAYYVYCLAVVKINKQSDFSYLLESSLRTIDSTATLRNGIGWMTYSFPQSISEHTASLDALQKFHQTTSASLQRGYEYGLLRYILRPEYFKKEPLPIWSLNYLGTAISGTQGVKIIETMPRRDDPFVEVDIRFDKNRLLFDHYDNTGLTDYYLDSLKAEIGRTVASLADECKSFSEVTISKERSAAILARLSNANED